jgi:hypothetical protein
MLGAMEEVFAIIVGFLGLVALFVDYKIEMNRSIPALFVFVGAWWFAIVARYWVSIVGPWPFPAIILVSIEVCCFLILVASTAFILIQSRKSSGASSSTS